MKALKVLPLLGLLLITGCAIFDAQPPRVEVEGPQKDPPLNKYQFEINLYDNLESLQKECGVSGVPNRIVIGCAEIFQQPCKIHILKQDWATYIHETQHCFHGIWHDSEGNIK